jgi:hypothetical protein
MYRYALRLIDGCAVLTDTEMGRDICRIPGDYMHQLTLVQNRLQEQEQFIHHLSCMIIQMREEMGYPKEDDGK